jgi:hypothetical protein
MDFFRKFSNSLFIPPHSAGKGLKMEYQKMQFVVRAMSDGRELARFDTRKAAENCRIFVGINLSKVEVEDVPRQVVFLLEYFIGDDGHYYGPAIEVRGVFATEAAAQAVIEKAAASERVRLTITRHEVKD